MIRSVADLHHFDAYPDPSFHFNVDPRGIPPVTLMWIQIPLFALMWIRIPPFTLDPSFHVDVDPDPTIHFNTILDPTIHFDVDPDPTFHFDPDQNPRPSDANVRPLIYGLYRLQFEPPSTPLCKRPRSCMAPFFDAHPDPASYDNVAPDPHH
jgi:hypothetical protein